MYPPGNPIVLFTLRRTRKNADAGDGWPTTMRGWRGWLKTAGRMDSRELAHALYRISRTLDERSMPARSRVQVLELLRPESRRALDYLAGRVHAQPLPLPLSAQAPYRIMIDLLEELASGYEHAVTGTNTPLAPARTAALAGERALALHGERMLRLMQGYTALPAGFWQRVNRLHDALEQAGLADREVPDSEIRCGPGNRQSPRTMYKRLLLLVLAGVHGFSRGETARLYRALEFWSHLAQLTARAKVEKGGLALFAIDLGSDEGPRPLEEARSGPSVRILDVSNLLLHIEQLRAESGPRENPAPALDEVSGSGLARLLDTWMPGTYQRHQRTRCGSEVDAEVSLARIRTRMQHDTRKSGNAVQAPPEWEQETFLEDLVLEEIPDSEMMLSRGSIGVRPGVNWNKVPEQNVPLPDHEAAPAGESATTNRDSESRWVLKDISTTGFCLLREGQGSCPIAVGEVVALRATDNGKVRGRWCVGFVRRITCLDGNRFQVGVEVLSCNALAADVRLSPPNSNRARHGDHGHRLPALLLPGDAGSDAPARLLAPAHKCRTGDEIELALGTRRTRFILGQMLEDTGLVSQHELALPKERGRRAPSHARFVESLQSPPHDAV